MRKGTTRTFLSDGRMANMPTARRSQCWHAAHTGEASATRRPRRRAQRHPARPGLTQDRLTDCATYSHLAVLPGRGRWPLSDAVKNSRYACGKSLRLVTPRALYRSWIGWQPRSSRSGDITRQSTGDRGCQALMIVRGSGATLARPSSSCSCFSS